jgi:drug/metabolite transporter (DMT)-like permease
LAHQKSNNHPPVAARAWTPWVTAGYALVVLIWGTTWFGIQIQLNGTSPHVSVGLRMAVASLIFFAIAIVRGEPLRLSRNTLLTALIPGVCFFGINYVAAYEGSRFLTSGVAAVVFGTAIPFNIVAERIIAGVRAPLSSWIAATTGMLGIALVFSADLEAALSSDLAYRGAALIAFSAAIVSIGNVLSAQLLERDMSAITINAYGMAIGTFTIFLWGLVSGADFQLILTPTWAVGFTYLVLVGSVLGFWTYMMLLPRIGPLSASYQVVLSPVVALFLSAAMEDFELGLPVFVGIALLLIGNSILVHGKAYEQKKSAS